MSETTELESGALMPAGLTEAEAIQRRARGEGNNVNIQAGRTYGQILYYNFFTFINIVLFVIGFFLVLLGLWTDAIVSVGVIMLNVIVNVVQEFRAKIKLDQIALLTRPRATVMRDGQTKMIDPSEIVLGDVIVVNAGDQIVVDGRVVGDGRIDVDESLLTGESDLVTKSAGDEVLSGSFCVNGSAAYEAQRVGRDSFANKLTISAKAHRVVRTPLQQDINFAVRIMLMIATLIGVLFAASFAIRDIPTTQIVQAGAVIAGLVPAGLVLMTATAYAMGAVRMAGRGALVQQANAVESMSNVDILCLDKTGTLTANRINLRDVQPVEGTEEDFRSILGDYGRSTRAGNRTSEALVEGCPGQVRQILDEIPFSSARKWSALALDDDGRRGVYVLGAPEMLRDYLPEDADIPQIQLDAWADEGLRVLLAAYSPAPVQLYDDAEQPHLPSDLKPLGIISFGDELRPEARQTLDGFREAGIELKIISGDNPNTVAALARQAGFPHDLKAVSGPELEGLNDVQIGQIAEETTVFGRITPQQKEALVSALKARGHYVAMIGDGVNDVLSLKKAQIGIAMQSGSGATRAVADIVLLNDSFAALPAAFLEGQRILNGMGDIIRLFLTRAFYAAIIILGTAVVADVELFPFIPKHASLITLITVGFPTFGLAAWARVGVPQRQLVKTTMRFIFPAAVTMALVALGVYLFYLNQHYVPVQDIPGQREIAINFARTALTTSIIFMGLVLILFVEPPTRLWVAGDDFSGDKRPVGAAAVMLATFIIILAYKPFRIFWELDLLGGWDYVFIITVSALWTVLLWYIWRAHLFEHFMGLEPKPMKFE